MDVIRHNPDTFRIEQLPDDILFLILSFLPILEIVRTSILSRRWRKVWLHITRLDFDFNSLLSVDQLTTGDRAWRPRFAAWVNKVIDARAAVPGLPLVKEFRIRFGVFASKGHHIDRWIGYAIENQVEKLYLDCSPYMGNISPCDQYKLSEESWYKTPSGLSSLKSLRFLFLHNVSASKQFIEFILSSCPLLEDLSMTFAGCYHDLHISGVPPLLLKRLNITLYEDFVLTVLDAPFLTSLAYRSDRFHPQKIDVPMLTDLTIGSPWSPQPVKDYLDHFSSYLPRLEKLELIMYKAQRFVLNKMPELVALKDLKILVNFGGSDSISCEIINFINACPLLETFTLEVTDETYSSRSMELIRRQRTKIQGLPKYGSFRCLKVLKLLSATVKTIKQEVMKYIIRSSPPHLKKLIIDSAPTCFHPDLFPCNLKKIEELEAKAKKLLSLKSCRSPDIEIIVTV